MVVLESGMGQRHVDKWHSIYQPFHWSGKGTAARELLLLYSQRARQAAPFQGFAARGKLLPFPDSMQSRPLQYRSDPVHYQFDKSNITTA